MRILTYKINQGDFYLDQYENIGDYIEVTEVKPLGSRRVKGQTCYVYQMDLLFCCNLTSTIESVSFYTFCNFTRRIFTELCIDPSKITCLRVIERRLVKGLLE